MIVVTEKFALESSQEGVLPPPTCDHSTLMVTIIMKELLLVFDKQNVLYEVIPNSETKL